MRILFVTSNRLGDAVLTTGLLDHLIRQHPGARITVACGPVAAGLFEHMPGLERVIVVEKQRYSLHWLRLWWQVVRTRWDLVADLRGSTISFELWTKRRAYLRAWRGGHRIEQIGAVLRLDPPPRPVAWTGPAEEARAAALLPEGAPWIALGPTANWNGKLWPPERYVALYRALSAPDGPLPGARAAILAGPGDAERAMAAPVLDAIPGALDLAGQLSLAEAAAVLRRAALFVGNDSGLMHLAAAAGAPTLGLFGPTPASEYAPVGRCAAAVLARGPAGSTPMAELPVEAVLDAARALLGEDAPAREPVAQPVTSG